MSTVSLLFVTLMLATWTLLSSFVLPRNPTGHSNDQRTATRRHMAGFGKPPAADDATKGKKKGFGRGDAPFTPSAGGSASAAGDAATIPKTADPCSCGSGRSYGACCGRLHTAVTSLVTRTSEFEVHAAAAAALAPFSAEEVLRARYTAYKVPQVLAPWTPLVRAQL
jgi:SEC-C motif